MITLIIMKKTPFIDNLQVAYITKLKRTFLFDLLIFAKNLLIFAIGFNLLKINDFNCDFFFIFLR